MLLSSLVELRQQQWDAIVSSLTGSAAFAVPSLVGIALIAVAVTVV